MMQRIYLPNMIFQNSEFNVYLDVQPVLHDKRYNQAMEECAKKKESKNTFFLWKDPKRRDGKFGTVSVHSSFSYHHNKHADGTCG